MPLSCRQCEESEDFTIPARLAKPWHTFFNGPPCPCLPMPDRFFSEAGCDHDVIELSGDEARHLGQVLRKRVGDEVCLFDGRGKSVVAVVEELGKRVQRLRVVERLPPDAAPRRGLLLATGVPKGDRARWLVEKATELGVEAWTPLVLQRGVAMPRDTRLDTLRAASIAACKQCGRNQILRIDRPMNWSDWLGDATGRGPVLVAHPGGMPFGEAVGALASNDAKCCSVAIGPEGGFTDNEIAVARESGARIISLGPRLLRIETAAAAVAAWFGLEAPGASSG